VNILEKKEAFAYLDSGNLRNSQLKQEWQVASTQRVGCLDHIALKVFSGPSLSMERAVPRFIIFLLTCLERDCKGAKILKKL